jgi:hypothetical protein
VVDGAIMEHVPSLVPLRLASNGGIIRYGVTELANADKSMQRQRSRPIGRNAKEINLTGTLSAGLHADSDQNG